MLKLASELVKQVTPLVILLSLFSFGFSYKDSQREFSFWFSEPTTGTTPTPPAER